MRLSRPIVLILSANPAFARELAAYWPADPSPPEFTVLEQNLFRDPAGSDYDLAIADAASPASAADLKHALAAAARPAILIRPGPQSPFLLAQLPSSAVNSSRDNSGRENSNRACSIIELTSDAMHAGYPLWPVIAGLLGREILLRCHAEERASEAETIRAAAEAEATLGGYIAEMRHNINNALTSVLGNAELLTLEPGISAAALAQSKTILNMALRLHEIFRRFSSIEKELSVSARPPVKIHPGRAAGVK